MPSFSPYTLGLNPYREIVFRSTSQIAGVRTVNRLFAPFSDVRKKKGLRISADPSSRMRKIGFIVVLLRGCLFVVSLFLVRPKSDRGDAPGARGRPRSPSPRGRAIGEARSEISARGQNKNQAPHMAEAWFLVRPKGLEPPTFRTGI